MRKMSRWERTKRRSLYLITETAGCLASFGIGTVAVIATVIGLLLVSVAVIARLLIIPALLVGGFFVGRSLGWW